MYFSWVRVMVMSTELSTKPKNVACCKGTNIDLSTFMEKPSSDSNFIVSSIEMQHISHRMLLESGDHQ